MRPGLGLRSCRFGQLVHVIVKGSTSQAYHGTGYKPAVTDGLTKGGTWVHTIRSTTDCRMMDVKSPVIGQCLLRAGIMEKELFTLRTSEVDDWEECSVSSDCWNTESEPWLWVLANSNV
ncbi:hypothetical protein CC1G_15211 [Coprinopsis cinerea okayama7|uniref:Uncharacterized protein n=1 Tax=Coprinopsis cinerea (strain Okayama-7 / 130 / ATCC MYA-4618 / FGSC 9003) TaxID=240176 RepID=D6RPJ6_COPC7|nr:hypothetical protein CC1G_15211 [Coprinopsis cinerea okayama7\|eukprot:XP_002910576.1 hypothetical protein CC1G_15211 [Coprinopsis cinerea okayama7\